MSNFIINTVRIKNKNVEYMLFLDAGQIDRPESDDVVRLRAMNNEYYLDAVYGMPDRDSARSFIEHHSSEFIKQELIRIAAGVDPSAQF